MDIEKKETYNTLREIKLRKELVLSKIRMDNQQIGTLWKELFYKPKPKKKGFDMTSLVTTGIGVADGFMFVWKLYKKFKK